MMMEERREKKKEHVMRSCLLRLILDTDANNVIK